MGTGRGKFYLKRRGPRRAPRFPGDLPLLPVLSAVREVADLQHEDGPGKCPFCERALTPYKGTGARAIMCFRADCRTEYERAFGRMRRGRYEAR